MEEVLEVSRTLSSYNPIVIPKNVLEVLYRIFRDFVLIVGIKLGSDDRTQFSLVLRNFG